MKPQEAVMRETRHIAVGTLILTAAMLAVFAILGRFDWMVLLGGIYGAIVATGNFFLLGITVQRIAETAGDDADSISVAKMRMRRSYTRRLVIGGALLVLAIVVLKLNWIACCCPLIFPRITIFAMNLKNSVRSVKGSGDIK